MGEKGIKMEMEERWEGERKKKRKADHILWAMNGY